MTTTRRLLKRVGLSIVITSVGLVAVAGVATLGIRGAVDDAYTAPDARTTASRADLPGPVHDAAKPTVAVVLGHEGTNVADSLAPYEVFATTGAFNVYTVAAEPDPVPLTGGLDLLPDLTFDELDELVGVGPDVIVVPQIHTTGDVSADPVVGWLRRQAEISDPLVLGVCVGAKVLAATGLLDGRPATSHWLGLIGLRRSNPAVRWRDGVRFVDDDDVITTGAVLSGVDGALRVVERLLGPEEAERVSRRLAWTGYVPGGPVAIPRNRPSPRRPGGPAQRRLPLGPSANRGPADRRGRRDRARLGLPALHRAVLPGQPGGRDRGRRADPVAARAGVRASSGAGHDRPDPGPDPGPRGRSRPQQRRSRWREVVRRRRRLPPRRRRVPVRRCPHRHRTHL